MSELTDLYQELILDHAKRPRNKRGLPPPAVRAEGHNPLCGDRVTVHVDVQDGQVNDVSFEGQGCAISTASASLMTETVKGKPLSDVRALFERVHQLLTTPPDQPRPPPEELGKLAAFAGVSEFPMRVKCASLAWHTLLAALDGKGDRTPVRTEEGHA